MNGSYVEIAGEESTDSKTRVSWVCEGNDMQRRIEASLRYNKLPML